MAGVHAMNLLFLVSNIKRHYGHEKWRFSWRVHWVHFQGSVQLRDLELYCGGIATFWHDTCCWLTLITWSAITAQGLGFTMKNGSKPIWSLPPMVWIKRALILACLNLDSQVSRKSLDIILTISRAFVNPEECIWGSLVSDLKFRSLGILRRSWLQSTLDSRDVQDSWPSNNCRCVEHTIL